MLGLLLPSDIPRKPGGCNGVQPDRTLLLNGRFTRHCAQFFHHHFYPSYNSSQFFHTTVLLDVLSWSLENPISRRIICLHECAPFFRGRKSL